MNNDDSIDDSIDYVVPVRTPIINDSTWKYLGDAKMRHYGSLLVVTRWHLQITYTKRQSCHRLDPTLNYQPNNTGYPAANRTIHLATQPAQPEIRRVRSTSLTETLYHFRTTSSLTSRHSVPLYVLSTAKQSLTHYQTLYLTLSVCPACVLMSTANLANKDM